MRQEALVNGKEALGPDGLGQAVEDALVKVSVLIIEPRHDGVFVTRVQLV